MSEINILMDNIFFDVDDTYTGKTPEPLNETPLSHVPESNFVNLCTRKLKPVSPYS